MPMTDPAVGLAVVRTRLMATRDHGGVAIVVALMLSSGVLLGMAALAIDVGNLYAERAQLLNGADAAALKVAQVCASTTGCASSSDTAGRYARENANDGAAAVEPLCGRGGGGDFPDCGAGAPSEAPTECIGTRPANPTPYVEVHTYTGQPDGSNLLPSIFAQALVGGFDGAKVRACARAAWGPPSRATGIALTISICDWKRDTGGGFPSVEREFPLYDETDPAACGLGGRTSAADPGGFRWLDIATSDCRATVSIGIPYDVRPGTARPAGCPDGLNALIDSPRPVLVPIFDSVAGAGGGSAEHTLHGFAAFVLTGWDMPGQAVGSGTALSCSGGASHCVYGYFTQAVVLGGGIVGGPELGARIVARAG